MTPPSAISSIGFMSVVAFQRAWNLGPRLVPDGICGPLTARAADLSMLRRERGLPDLSAHFGAHEFACRCGGALPGCSRLLVLRDLLQSLEQLRAAMGRPISIVSGFRCPQRNAAVGGAQHSQHIHGAAADIHPMWGPNTIRALHAFAGIGYGAASGLVVHVDRRDLTGGPGTLAAPAVFTDGQ